MPNLIIIGPVTLDPLALALTALPSIMGAVFMLAFVRLAGGGVALVVDMAGEWVARLEEWLGVNGSDD